MKINGEGHDSIPFNQMLSYVDWFNIVPNEDSYVCKYILNHSEWSQHNKILVRLVNKYLSSKSAH